MYDILESDSKKPLYPGCKKSLTLLSTVLTLVNIKARYGWSNKNFTSMLQVVQDMLPDENMLPKSYYKAKKILCPIGNWKEVPVAQKDLIWEDVQAEFNIPEAFD